MKICLAVLMVAVLGSAFATDVSTLFGLRIVAGAAAGGIIPLGLALVGDRVEMAGRQVAISRFIVAVIIGQLAGSSLAGILADQIGWRGVLALSASIGLAAFIATAIGFRSVPRGGVFDLATAIARYREILANRRARMLFGLVFVEAIAVFGIFPYMAPLIEARGEGGPAEAGLALAGFAVGGLAYSALLRWLLAQLGLRWMLIAGGAIAASALLLLGVAGPWQLDAAATTLLGFGFYMIHNSFQTQVTEIAPNARASAVAVHAFSFFVGQALGVVVVGLGLRSVGLIPTMLVAAAAILSVGCVAASVLTRPGDRRARQSPT